MRVVTDAVCWTHDTIAMDRSHVSVCNLQIIESHALEILMQLFTRASESYSTKPNGGLVLEIPPTSKLPPSRDSVKYTECGCSVESWQYWRGGGMEGENARTSQSTN